MTEFKNSSAILRKQQIMRRVLIAMIPCIAGSIYYFGWRCLFLVVWSAITGFITEFIFTRNRGEGVTEAVFVTTTIFTLIMPPAVSLHVLTIGVIFAVMFAKEVFGGFGHNAFNPAIAGRCFVYICFPVALTATWSLPAEGMWGALDKWSTAVTADAITTATPMAYLKAGNLILNGKSEGVLDNIPFKIGTEEKVYVKKSILFKGQFFGRISGTMGVTSALLISIGGIYLFFTKTASRAIILSLIITYAVLNQLLFLFGVEPVPGAWPAVLGGGFLFGAFYMATDPISAPKIEPAKIIYGMLIATSTVIIRNFSIFNGGLMFSILIGNMFAPILDHIAKSYKRK